MPIRVLVVDDSLTVRARLCEALAADRDLAVVGEAADGRRAIELCESLKPDVITLDMMLPEMTGLAATEYIMANCPTPILIVSASTNRGELFKTYEALAAGAIDVMDKPRIGDDDADWERRFVSTVKLISRIKVITHPRARLAGRTVMPDAQRHDAPRAHTPVVSHDAILADTGTQRRFRLVAIGASTGGPGALLQVLGSLPAKFPVPVLVVLHIGEQFSGGFAEWLDGQLSHTVRFAQDGQRLAGSGIWLAPPERHLSVSGNSLRLLDGPERHSCRPSVDTLFESVAREFGSSAVGCLLTGMGRDGAQGLLDMRNAGAMTIAQDEATSTVYGMPREAAAMGAAERILPLSEIGPAIALAAREHVMAEGR